ncbi:MAG: hypothetical protein RL419_1747 [Actinomycetota bacterium]
MKSVLRGLCVLALASSTVACSGGDTNDASRTRNGVVIDAPELCIDASRTQLAADGNLSIGMCNWAGVFGLATDSPGMFPFYVEVKDGIGVLPNIVWNTLKPTTIRLSIGNKDETQFIEEELVITSTQASPAAPDEDENGLRKLKSFTVTRAVLGTQPGLKFNWVYNRTDEERYGKYYVRVSFRRAGSSDGARIAESDGVQTSLSMIMDPANGWEFEIDQPYEFTASEMSMATRMPSSLDSTVILVPRPSDETSSPASGTDVDPLTSTPAPVHTFSAQRVVSTVDAGNSDATGDASGDVDVPTGDGAGNETPPVAGVEGSAPTNLTVERLNESDVAVSWTNPSWPDFGFSQLRFRYANMEIGLNGEWVNYVFVDVGTQSSWTGRAPVMPNMGDLDFRVTAVSADKSKSYQSETVRLVNPTPPSTTAVDEMEAVVDACSAVENVDELVSLVGGPFTTDEPVIVETTPGCDIPQEFADKVRVDYSFTLVGETYFTDWTANGLQFPQSLGTYSQLLPADKYTLSFSRHVLVEGRDVNGEVSSPVSTKSFEVGQGTTESNVQCADTDLKMSGESFEFACQYVNNISLATLRREGDPKDDGYASGTRSLDLAKWGSGWHRVELWVTGALLRQMWRLYLCHTNCGAVAPPAGYSATKSGEVISLELPPCDSPQNTPLDLGFIAPLRAVSPGVLRRARFDYARSMATANQKSFDNLDHETLVRGRSDAITITNGADIAGLEFAENAVCMKSGNVTELVVFAKSADATPSSETTEPPKVDTPPVVQPLTVDVASVIASPVKLADNVTRVDVTLTDSSDDSSALSMSLDGTTWVPVPRGQPVSLNRSDVASLQVRSVNSKGEMRQVVQTVVSNASGESSSNVSGTVSGVSDSSSSSKLWIVVVILVLLVLIAVLMRGRRSKAKD